MTRRYPVAGRNNYLPLLDSADYVEFSQFAGPNLGYFCGTCAAFRQDARQESSSGTCAGLQNAPVRSYGCCNLWQLAPAHTRVLADGSLPESVRGLTRDNPHYYNDEPGDSDSDGETPAQQERMRRLLAVSEAALAALPAQPRSNPMKCRSVTIPRDGVQYTCQHCAELLAAGKRAYGLSEQGVDPAGQQPGPVTVTLVCSLGCAAALSGAAR